MPTAILKIYAKDAKPNDCFDIAGVPVRIRYCYYNNSDIATIRGRVSFDLHREEDPLHPLCDKTFMKVDMYQDEEIEVRRDV